MDAPSFTGSDNRDTLSDPPDEYSAEDWYAAAGILGGDALVCLRLYAAYGFPSSLREAAESARAAANLYHHAERLSGRCPRHGTEACGCEEGL